jgi:hypothetical protein
MPWREENLASTETPNSDRPSPLPLAIPTRKNAVSGSDYTQTMVGLMKDMLKSMWKETIVAYFKV